MNAFCYWSLCERGETAQSATDTLSGKGQQFKHDLLHGVGINFNEIPVWQKRGVGFSWKDVVSQGQNPKTGELVATTRRKLIQHDDLPVGEAFEVWVNAQIV